MTGGGTAAGGSSCDVGGCDAAARILATFRCGHLVLCLDHWRLTGEGILATASFRQARLVQHRPVAPDGPAPVSPARSSASTSRSGA